MKTLIKNLTKLVVVTVIAFAGTAFADASFVSDPSTQGNGITSIGYGYYDANDDNSISADIPDYNDSQEFYVFMDYQNAENYTLTNVRARLSTSISGSTLTFTGKLSANNGGQRTDTAFLTNVPEEWNLQLLSAHKVNTHGSQCGSLYEYNTSINGLTSSNGALIGDLDTVGQSQTNGYSGGCSQGHVVAKFRITNTYEDQTTYSWEVGDWGQCVNGIETRTVTCVNDQTGAIVADSNCNSASEPSDTQTCPDDGLVVETDPATNVDSDSARLNGDVISGGPIFSVWFTLSSTDTTPECSNGNDQLLYPNQSEISSGSNPSFYDFANGLNDGITYYYRACANNGFDTASGNVRVFTTDEDYQPATYSWDVGDWGQCINGEQTRPVFCVNDLTGNTVADSNCNANTEPNDTQACGTQTTYSWEVGDWGACINNIEERDVYCVNNQTGATVADSYCNANTEPNDQQNCNSGGDILNVDTLNPTNVDVNSAQLNGDLISGGPADLYWFVLSSSDSTPGCTDFSGVQILYPNENEGEIGGGTNPNFSDDANGLSDDTTYYYRACVREGATNAQGDVVSFTTDSSGNNPEDEPQAETEEEDDVEDNSAELNGRIKMNDYDNGIVFFVYGQDEDRIDDVENDYNSYEDANDDEDNDEFEVVLVDSNNDDNNWRDYSEDVSGLDEDERYYYQICVEYEDNGNEELECGGIESFYTDEDDNNNNDDVEIRTTSYDDLGATFATLCGDLEDNGGDNSLRTRIEFRRNDGFSSWVGSDFRQRGEGAFCVEVNNLQPSTPYQYRACTDEGDCGNTRNFITNPINFGGPVAQVNVNTLYPTAVSSNAAVLNGAYQGSPNEPTQVWFEWGRTAALGTQKRVYTKSAAAGTFSDGFTALRSCTEYYYRAVARNSTGIKYGNIISFRTSCVINTGGPTVVTQPPVVTIVEEVEDTTIDLDSLGLGLSLLRLEIDNEQGTLFRDQIVQYEIRWENISNIDLDNIDLKIAMPEEIEVTNISRGRFDADENLVFYTIDELDEGDFGSMVVSGIVTNGSLGDVITAEATAAYDNPINDAQENAIDYDIDEFVLNTNFGTASVFGLSNITFLGWLTILLGLLIIFLIARWLYLEREELRAQAYANGYRPQVYGDPRYDYNRGPAGIAPNYGGGYQDPNQALGAPQNYNSFDGGNSSSGSNGYQPYRPNRG